VKVKNHQYHNDTDVKTDVWEKTVEVLINKSEVSKSELIRLSGYGNRNKFFEYLKQWELNKLIKIRRPNDREILVSLASPDKKVNTFIKNFGKKLDYYEKQLNIHLTALDKNKPLISPNQPMKKIKTKTGVLELDKKSGVYRDMGKTQDSHAYTWKTRAKPRMHFEIILNLLNRLYQESSIFTFGTSICDDPTLMKKYQTRSEKLIKHTVNKIENMFRDKRDNAFVVTRIRMVLYGFVYKATMEAEFKKIQIPFSKVP